MNRNLRGTKRAKIYFIFEVFSTSTNLESSCDVVLSSTRQHGALVDPSTPQHDDVCRVDDNTTSHMTQVAGA